MRSCFPFLTPICFVALLLGAPVPFAGAQTHNPPKAPLNRGLANWLLPDPKDFRAGEVLAVELTPQALEKVRALGFTALHSQTLPALGITITRLAVPTTMTGLDLARHDHQSAILLHYRYRIPAIRDPAPEQFPHTVPCPPERCYGPGLIGWHPELSSCARGMRIGLIASAVDEHHVAFRGTRVAARTFRQPHQLPAPATHTTAVLALLAGDRASNTPGLIPDADFFVADVISADQTGTPAIDAFNLITALDWMAQSAADIVMLNFFAPNDPLLHDAIATLSKRGMLFVAPAGDDGPAAPLAYPAAYKEVIAVTAIDKNLAPYRYANHGDYIDLAAPGVQIWTALPGNKQAALSGTSLAAAFATAVIAATYPSLAHTSKEAVLSRLQYQALGRTGRDPIVGRGLLQAPGRCSPQ